MPPRFIFAILPLVVALHARAATESSSGNSGESAPGTTTSTTKDDPADEIEEHLLSFTAEDGVALEAKLSLPAGAGRPVPVVFHLHGAGPRNYDHALRYRDAADGQTKTMRYYDFHAREYARRGLAFFRMSKRGCTSEPSGRPRVDRAVFSKATPTILVADYARALDALRARPEIDRTRIVLTGASEGTRLAPELALRSPDGIVGLVLCAYAADNTRDTVVWQNTIGPWRNVQMRIPAAADGALTREEYDAALPTDPTLERVLPFAPLDTNADSSVTAAELEALNRVRLDAILKAVEERNDDFLWQYVVNLSSAYLRGDWEAEPTHTMLLKLDVPIAILHGDLDGTCRVEGVHETEAAFRAAGKSNLRVHIYPGYDHDLNWTTASAPTGGSAAHQEAFNTAAEFARIVR